MQEALNKMEVLVNDENFSYDTKPDCGEEVSEELEE